MIPITLNKPFTLAQGEQAQSQKDKLTLALDSISTAHVSNDHGGDHLTTVRLTLSQGKKEEELSFQFPYMSRTSIHMQKKIVGYILTLMSTDNNKATLKMSS
jgi:hypothetical protein